MSRITPLRRFVKENIVLLTSEKGTVSLIRRKKQLFVGQHSLKSAAVFSIREVARETLSYLMETSRIKAPEDFDEVMESSPFLKRYLRRNDIGEARLVLEEYQSNILSREDLSKLSQEEFIREKTEELKKVAEEKAKEEIEEERRRLHELKSNLEEQLKLAERMVSELDDLPEAVDPEKLIADSVAAEEAPSSEKVLFWWERLGLSADPFPTKLGFNRIPKEKYEDIVVRTKIFKSYLEMLSRRPEDLFGKTILITGQFGSGKTSFFQYLSYKLAAHNILPIQVILDPVRDPELIRENMHAAIFNEVSSALMKRGLSDPRANGARLDIDTVVSVLEFLATQSGLKGYVVTVDGLHKAETTLDSSLEFVKQLQNFHEHLDSHGINISILVAGSPLWTRTLTQNPSFSGSFYRIDEVPNLSPKGAFKLVDKRLRAYESDSGIPVFLDKTGIEFAFKQVGERHGGTVTFRSFIDYILPRLEKGDYESAGISVAIDREAFEKIDGNLRGSAISQSYKRYRKMTARKSRLRQSCSDILHRIYKKGYIEEREDFFLRNKGSLWVLSKCALIEKVKSNGKRFGWGFSKDFLTALENLNEIGMPPEVIFRSFSMSPEKLPIVDARRGDPTLIAAQDFLAKYSSEWPELVVPINDFLDSHDRVLSSHDESEGNLCDACRAAISALIVANQIVLGTRLTPDEWVRTTWLDVPVPDAIASLLTTTPPARSQKYEFLQRYHQSARVLLDVLNDFLKANKVVNLVDTNLSKADLRGLLVAAVSLEDGDLDRAVDELNTRLEAKIRATFHLAFSLHYGSEYTQHIPEQILKRLEESQAKGQAVLKRKVDPNLFFHFSRSEYAELVNNKKHWRMIFESVFRPRQRDEVVLALQRSFSLDDRRAHRDRPDFFRKVREDIRSSIASGHWLLESLDNVFALALNPPGIVDTMSGDAHKIRISFVGEGQCAQSAKLRMSGVTMKEITTRLLAYPLDVELELDSSVPATFGYGLPEVCVVGALLIREGKLDVEFLDGTSLVKFVTSDSRQSE